MSEMLSDRLFLILTPSLLLIPIIWALTDPRPILIRIKQYLKLKTILFISFEGIVIYSAYVTKDTFNIYGTLGNLLTLLGIIIFYCGLILAIWAKLKMGRFWGMPAEHDTKRQNELITSGPFAFSRNPIYLSLILICFGYFLSLKSISIILSLVVYIYFYYASIREENLLEGYFSHKYRNYKSKVRRFI